MYISEFIFTKLLALDAYFKGYPAGTSGFPQGFPTGQIGNATLFMDDATNTAVAEGFYAAYEINGVTVISYRGTDSNGELVLTDFNIAQGTWEDDSALYAMQF